MKTKEKQLLAEVFQLSHGIGFKIPKKNGRGFLKSCVGWHGLNKQGKALQDLLDGKEYVNIRYGEFCDLDDYLLINVRAEFMVDHRRAEEVQKDLEKIILQVFPFVQGFIETDK